MGCIILQMENQKIVWHGVNPLDAVLYSFRIIFSKPDVYKRQGLTLWQRGIRGKARSGCPAVSGLERKSHPDAPIPADTLQNRRGKDAGEYRRLGLHGLSLIHI